MAEHVTIFEVGPRDGLQNEKWPVRTGDKIQLVDLLSASGLSKIEATSFVSPKWVPQLADAANVMAGIQRRDGVRYAVLTPNMKGFEAAVDARSDEIAIFASASEGFSRKNINCTIQESLERFRPVLAAAKLRAIPVRGYISCVTDCPYDGPTPAENVAALAGRLLDMGCYEISLGDTIGAGTPESVARMLDAVLSVAPPERLAGHFHDTCNRALDNIETSLERGLRVFDAAIGGLGGCPYAPGATGNVSTESVNDLLNQKGYNTGVNKVKLEEAKRFAHRVTRSKRSHIGQTTV
ncbi:hydroxymethylglutaryl-CoA lyase [Hoeflea sp. CAU 1731]